MQELAEGLWRWTAPHPDWRQAAPGSSGDWAPDVGCGLHLTGDRATFFDPLLPEDVAGFWELADALVGAREVHVLTTVRWHARSREELITRYRASTSRARGALAPDVVPFRVPGAQEVIFWIPAVGALVPGDRLIGDGDGGLQVCPQSWIEDLPSQITVTDLRERLRPLLELPVQHVLVSHGEPVLGDGRVALRRALIGSD